jgi:hypothetical protein
MTVVPEETALERSRDNRFSFARMFFDPGDYRRPQFILAGSQSPLYIGKTIDHPGADYATLQT